MIPNGIDLKRFRPLDKGHCCNKLGWNPNRFHVLVPDPGTRPRKRIELAETAVFILQQKGISIELHKLSGIPHEEVPLWLNASDVLLLTSIHEGSPNIVKEALACNRPVVSFDVGDVRERLEGIKGCYLAQANPKDLTRNLALVLNGPKDVEGRVKMEKLSLEAISKQLIEFYEFVLMKYQTPKKKNKMFFNALV